MFSPLADIRVLDLTTSVAGPFATSILGALGADVTKVERPDHGDDTRSWGPPFLAGESATFLALNPNKRSVVLDLRSDEGRAAVLRLAQDVDVFVQSLRPGLVDELGIGFEAVRERNPGIVYVAISAFGTKGPLANRLGYDPLMQAASGIMSMTGEEGRPPVRTGVSLVDQGTSLWATIGILAALRARDDSAPKPQLIDISLYETAINYLPYQVVGYLATGQVPRAMGSAVSIIAPYEAFEATDGWVMVAAGNDRLFARLCLALDMPELKAEDRFRTNAARIENRDALTSLIATRIGTESVSKWLVLFERHDVPAAPVQNLAQAVNHPQTEALGLLQPLPREDIPDLRLVALPLTINGDRVAHRTPPPALGSDTRAVLDQAGLDAGLAD